MPEPIADAPPPEATASLLHRWYGTRAKQFVLEMRQGRAQAGDQPAVDAWNAVLDALRRMTEDNADHGVPAAPARMEASHAPHAAPHGRAQPPPLPRRLFKFEKAA